MEMEMEQDSVHVGGPQQGFGNNTGFGMNGGFNPMMNMGMGMPGFGNMPNMMGKQAPLNCRYHLVYKVS